jgi:hypothetical protein
MQRCPADKYRWTGAWAWLYAAAVQIAIGNRLMWPLLVAQLSEKTGEIGRIDVLA